MKKVFQRFYPYKKNGRYYNYEGERFEPVFFRTLNTYLRSSFKRHTHTPEKIAQWIAPSSERMSSLVKNGIIWLGHSSFLIFMNGTTILTDPIFGHISHVYKRVLPVGMTIDQLPPIDIVLISHNHRDHMDYPSLNALRRRMNCTFLVPDGDKKWFDWYGFSNVIEHSWWQKTIIFKRHNQDESLACTFLPAWHWSQRGVFDKNKSLWGSWLLEKDGKRIYFGGDTGYANHFSAIKKKYGSIDTAILPIGPCAPRQWLQEHHMDADQAGQAFLDLNADNFVPMHWGTFLFGVDTFDAPMIALQSWWAQHHNQLIAKKLHPLKIGQVGLLGLIEPILPKSSFKHDVTLT